MGKVISFDIFLTYFFNKIIPHNIFFDYFFSFFSLKGASILIWLLVILIIVFLEERKNPGISKRDRKIIVLFSLSFLLTFLISDIVFKNIFLRPRPMLSNFIRLNPIASNFICPTDFSFPSTHAATAFAAATILTFFDKKRRWFYYTIAVLISFSRIYLGCHYLLDVVFGMLIGYLISKLILRIFPDHIN